MENTMTLLVTELGDTELIKGVKEIQASDKTGIIGENDLVRDIAKECNKFNFQGVGTNLFLAQQLILKEAAYRWVFIMGKDDEILKH